MLRREAIQLYKEFLRLSKELDTNSGKELMDWVKDGFHRNRSLADEVSQHISNENMRNAPRSLSYVLVPSKWRN